MSLTIAEATSTTDRAACIDLRTRVFVDEQGVRPEEEIDGLDDAALHLLARSDGMPVGTLRLRFLGDTVKVERVCVLPQARGKAVGQALMRHALGLAAARSGIARAALGAQLSAIGFYDALGFRAEGPEFLDAGIPHRKMVLPL